MASDGPEKLSRYNTDEICRWCVRGGLFLADVPTEEPATGPEGCDACGTSGVSLNEAGLCPECMAEPDHKGAIWTPYAPKSPEPPVEETLAELLQAARVLIKRDALEDQLFPTLAFAGCVPGGSIPDAIDLKNRLVKTWGKPRAWETEVASFVSRFPSVRPVEVVDETLILQQEPVNIETIPYPQTDIPELVEIHVYQRRKRTKPEEIARRYEEKLSAAGIACDVEDRLLPMFADPFEGRVIITVPNHKPDVPANYAEAVWRGEQPRFQHPDAVRGYCELAIGSPRKDSSGFATGLNMRGAKGISSSKWLVPACVVLSLRTIARIEDKQEIYRLLNEHVYGEKRFLGDGSDTGTINTLWDYVDNNPARVQKPLGAARGMLEHPK